jgi:hypothetical protein
MVVLADSLFPSPEGDTVCHRYNNGCWRICNCESSRQEPEEAYARALLQLAQYYQSSPEQLSEEELRQYFLYLVNEKKIARPTATPPRPTTGTSA